jgi:hypothetical protein
LPKFQLRGLGRVSPSFFKFGLSHPELASLSWFYLTLPCLLLSWRYWRSLSAHLARRNDVLLRWLSVSMRYRPGRSLTPGPFWHPYLLALRSHPSIISANSQVLRAVTGQNAQYIKAESVGRLTLRSANAVVDVENVWNVSWHLYNHLQYAVSIIFRCFPKSICSYHLLRCSSDS